MTFPPFGTVSPESPCPLGSTPRSRVVATATQGAEESLIFAQTSRGLVVRKGPHAMANGDRNPRYRYWAAAMNSENASHQIRTVV